MIILVFFIAPYINLNQLNPKLDPYEFNRTILLSNFYSSGHVICLDN